MRSVERRLATVVRLAARLEFFFDPGNSVLQLLPALFLLRIAECCICRKSALMRTPGGFVDSLAGRRIMRIRLGKCIPDRALNTFQRLLFPCSFFPPFRHALNKSKRSPIQTIS